MLHNDFLRKVAKLSLKAAQLGFRPVSAVAGEGVAIVRDSQGEYDTYFDAEKWEFVVPDAWDPIQGGIGILPGKGTIPSPRSFEETVRFAASHLRSKDPARLLSEQPQLVES